jgi:hypothetical protein
MSSQYNLDVILAEITDSDEKGRLLLYRYIAGGEQFMWRRILGPFGLCEFSKDDMFSVSDSNNGSSACTGIIWTDSTASYMKFQKLQSRTSSVLFRRRYNSLEQQQWRLDWLEDQRILASKRQKLRTHAIDYYDKDWCDLAISTLSTSKITRNGATVITVRQDDPETFTLLFIDDFEFLTASEIASRIYGAIKVEGHDWDVLWRGRSLVSPTIKQEHDRRPNDEVHKFDRFDHRRFTTSSCFHLQSERNSSGPRDWTNNPYTPLVYLHRSKIENP